MPDAEVQALLDLPAMHNQVTTVTTPEVYTMGNGKYHIAVMNFGIKQNILNFLLCFNTLLTVFPASATAEKGMACNTNGIFLSNGPGDPKDLEDVIQNVKNLIGRPPIFGICLGHQLMALANGPDTYKMKFGHLRREPAGKGFAAAAASILALKTMAMHMDPASIKGKDITVTHISYQ